MKYSSTQRMRCRTVLQITWPAANLIATLFKRALKQTKFSFNVGNNGFVYETFHVALLQYLEGFFPNSVYFCDNLDVFFHF